MAEFLIKNLPPEKIGKMVGILNAETDLRIRWPAERTTTVQCVLALLEVELSNLWHPGGGVT